MYLKILNKFLIKKKYVIRDFKYNLIRERICTYWF